MFCMKGTAVKEVIFYNNRNRECSFDKIRTVVEETGRKSVENMTEKEEESAAAEAVAEAQKEENGAFDEPDSSCASELEQRIIDQVEYYFGDINLPRDRFLAGEAKKDNGWIPMNTLIRFNRLKQLSDDFAVILTALRKSQTGLLEIDQTEQKVRRSLEHPLPDNSLEYWKSVKLRTLYVKGFPRQLKLDELQKFFSAYGKVDHILMRRVQSGDRAFKGSVFVTFSTVQECEEFLQNSPVRYDERSESDFVKEKQENYYKRKNQERANKKLQVKASKRQQQGAANRNKKAVQAPPEFQPGMVLRVSNLKKGSCNLKHLKQFFNAFGSVYFINFLDSHNAEADVTFSGGENSAGKAWVEATAEDGVVTVNDCEIQGTVLDDESAKSSWEETQNAVKRVAEGAPGPKREGGRNKDRGRQKAGHKGRQRGKREGGRIPGPRGKKKKFSSSDEEEETGTTEESSGKKRGRSEDSDEGEELAEKKPKLESEDTSESVHDQDEATA